MRYEGTIYRPPSEAESYLLQCTVGCSHNRCTFCAMYKDKKYRVRSLADIQMDISMAKNYYGDLEEVFLCDGDAIAIETPMLLEILDTLYRTFPSLKHVGSYVGPQSTLEKSMSDLGALRAAGLTKVYLGVESGLEDVLIATRKGVNLPEMREAGLRLGRMGYELSIMILLGLAGPGERSREHALATARLCNEMQPRSLASLTVVPIPGTELYRQTQDGRFTELTPRETLVELRTMLDAVDVDNMKFFGLHVSNYLPLAGRLPRDREAMFRRIDHALATKKDSDFVRHLGSG